MGDLLSNKIKEIAHLSNSGRLTIRLTRNYKNITDIDFINAELPKSLNSEWLFEIFSTFKTTIEQFISNITAEPERLIITDFIEEVNLVIKDKFSDIIKRILMKLGLKRKTKTEIQRYTNRAGYY